MFDFSRETTKNLFFVFLAIRVIPMLSAHLDSDQHWGLRLYVDVVPPPFREALPGVVPDELRKVVEFPARSRAPK